MPFDKVDYGAKGLPIYRVGSCPLDELAEVVQDSWLVQASPSVVVASPVLVLAVQVDWLGLILALIIGPLVLVAGIRWGGRRLEQRYPEVLTTVSR